MSNILPFPDSRSREDSIGVLEFFAGIGLARMGLEKAGFTVLWANDYEPRKHEMYAQQFGPEHPYKVGDVGNVQLEELPRGAELAWASSPCTDLSLAGNRKGLAGKESSAFYKFIDILDHMQKSIRPKVAVLENVVGLATSNGGEDLAAAVMAFNELGYSVDVLTLDARRFLAQSRPRLFLVASMDPPKDVKDPGSELRPDWLQHVFGDPRLTTHRAEIAAPPPPWTEGFSKKNFVEEMEEDDPRWWNAERQAAFERSLAPLQQSRVEALRRASCLSYRTAYRRTRKGVPVWEVRADDIAGCLRTARGGSSKQAVVRLGNDGLKVRWMTGLEYARLMGADAYNLDGMRDSQIQFAFGDAVAVPVVNWLGDEYLMPLVKGTMEGQAQGQQVLSLTGA